MKKAFIFLAVVTAALAFSCAKENPNENKSQQKVEKVAMTFSTGAEMTKAILDGQKVKFVMSDKLGVFDGTQINEFTVKSISSEGTSASFEGEAAVSENYILILPASAGSIGDEGYVDVTVPGNQYVDASHCLDSAAMIASACAQSGTEVSLSNQFSLVKFTISRSDVLSVTISGNDNETVSGTNRISTSDGTIDLTQATGKTATVMYKNNSGTTDVFPVGDYYIAIWPVTFTSGFTIRMNTDEKVAFKTTGSSYEFLRNGGKNFSTIDGNTTKFLGKTINDSTELRVWAKYARFWTNGDKFELGADIDLENKNWPTVASFAGSLDGKGYSIKNFTVDNAATRTGFIGTLEANAELKNITFGASSGDASSITLCQSDDDNWCYAGIVGYVQKGASLANLTSYVPVTISAACTGKHSAGGFAGNMKANTSVTGCVNNAAVTDNSSYASTDADACIGGIVGMSDSAGSIIKDCTNAGDDKSPINNNCVGTVHVGGIVGRVSGGGTVEGCTNDAYVFNNAASAYNNSSFKVGTAGIAGAVTGTNATIIKCRNEERAQITVAQTTRVGIGGIVGIATGAGLQILGCTNDAGTLSAEFTNTKDIAIGGIIGFSDNTIKISKAEDGTYTSMLRGITQNKDYSGTAYVGGIAGLLDKDSDDNIVEYCTTASGNRLYFSKNGNSKTLNMGGICGASKGIIRNCTNNMHVYARKGSSNYLYVKYGGICGGASNTRHPRLVTQCTNNGNFGPYNLDGNSVFGGIVAAMYPGAMDVTFCKNTGTVTSGQCQASGGIQSCQSNTSVDFGGLCGDLLYPAKGTEPVTIFEGCIIDCKIIVKNQSDYRYIGLVAGWPSGINTEIGYPKLIVGTTANPIQFINTTKVETGTDANPTVETVLYEINTDENAKKIFFGPYLFKNNRTDGKGNFTSIDGDDFTARFELNFTVGDPVSSAMSTEKIQ